MVGGLGSSLMNNASAADLAGLGSANLSSSYGSGLNVNNAGNGSGGGYLGSSNSFNNASGVLYDAIIIFRVFVCVFFFVSALFQLLKKKC